MTGWYIPGTNTSHPWREGEIWVPASATGGKASIDVAIQFVSSDNDWNEFGYEAYSISQ